MLVTVTLQCSVFLMSTVTAVYSATYGQCHSAVFSAACGQWHSLVFSAAYGQCHSLLFSAPYGHSAPYRRSVVVMIVPGPRTASRLNDAAASHSSHFHTVLYPRSYSECQLSLNPSCHDNPGAAFSVQNYRKIFAFTALFSLAPLQTCQHIYNAI